jgi:hypothetical protein
MIANLALRFVACALPIALFVSEYAWFARQLPPAMATSFGASGQGAAAGSTLGMVGFDLALLAGLGALFCVAVPLLITVLPASMVNFPNKDYWLTPPTRPVGIAKIGNWMAIFWAGFGTGMALVFGLVLMANLSNPPHLSNPAFMAVTGGMVGWLVVWVIALQVAFRVPAR